MTLIDDMPARSKRTRWPGPTSATAQAWTVGSKIVRGALLGDVKHQLPAAAPRYLLVEGVRALTC
eukprot:349608-Chlamydomonas_euryale.AAC.12